MNNDILFKDLNNIAAMKIDFRISPEEILKMSSEIDNVASEHWYWCTFRKSFLLCLYGNENVDNKSVMNWLPCAEKCITLKNFCETHIFSMTDIKPRIIVIKTLEGMEMSQHIDCSIDKINKFEPKLRLILKGKEKNNLYFVKDNIEKIKVSKEWDSYIMSGNLLHGMDNIDGVKYTLCFGEPWEGDNLRNTNFLNFIRQNYIKYYNTECIKISDLGDTDHVRGLKTREHKIMKI